MVVEAACKVTSGELTSPFKMKGVARLHSFVDFVNVTKTPGMHLL